jgi:hypothetical protein
MATIGTVAADSRKRYPKLMVEIANAKAGREPTFGVHERVGDSYILTEDRWPTPTKTNSYSGPSTAAPVAESPPKSVGQMLWPNMK